MPLIGLLIIVPLVVACLLFFAGNSFLQKIIMYLAVAILAAVSLTLLAKYFNTGVIFFDFQSEIVNQIIFIAEIILAAVIFYLSIKYKQYIVSFLILLQTFLAFVLEKSSHLIEVAQPLYLDQFSLIMALIIAIIGGLICIYAVSYMKDFHEDNPKVKDRRPYFFFVVFLFLSSMFGLIFSNNLMWLYFFWEVTTLCSFLLIGYKKDPESIKNSFWALTINLIGGICFVVALIYLVVTFGILQLDALIYMEKFLVAVPLILLGVAGLTKSAQLPFSTWLTGAMVAPTPVSALLHSSTMVKAGVFLLVKLAPLFQGSLVGVLIALIGGITFLITSFIAISQSDAKKVLAYSTIANLGLIVMCAGIGTYEAVWAAILLIIFHAISKGLLFLCVGSAEHILHSRDIESMDGLSLKAPKLAWIMLIGMAGMFLAPFGMLVSKWAVLKALTDVHPSLTILLIFGSAATLFFWVKWMGKLLIGVEDAPIIENSIAKSVWFVLFSLASLTIAVCLLFPVISYFLIEPYILNQFGHKFFLGEGNILIMLMMMGLLFLFPVTFPWVRKDETLKISPPYLAGLNAKNRNCFYNSFHESTNVSFKNYYFTKYFSEKILLKIGYVLSLSILMILFVRICL
ncbi:MAG: proton-conducting transporter membrane subunit [Candidatus Margulisiibacteriota bacterium]|jgi:ech hydrogenase subunit A